VTEKAGKGKVTRQGEKKEEKRRSRPSVNTVRRGPTVKRGLLKGQRRKKKEKEQLTLRYRGEKNPGQGGKLKVASKGKKYVKICELATKSATKGRQESSLGRKIQGGGKTWHVSSVATRKK